MDQRCPVRAPGGAQGTQLDSAGQIERTRDERSGYAGVQRSPGQSHLTSTSAGGECDGSNAINAHECCLKPPNRRPPGQGDDNDALGKALSGPCSRIGPPFALSASGPPRTPLRTFYTDGRTSGKLATSTSTGRPDGPDFTAMRPGGVRGQRPVRGHRIWLQWALPQPTVRFAWALRPKARLGEGGPHSSRGPARAALRPTVHLGSTGHWLVRGRWAQYVCT